MKKINNFQPSLITHSTLWPQVIGYVWADFNISQTHRYQRHESRLCSHLCDKTWLPSCLACLFTWLLPPYITKDTVVSLDQFSRSTGQSGHFPAQCFPLTWPAKISRRMKYIEKFQQLSLTPDCGKIICLKHIWDGFWSDAERQLLELS